MKHDTNVTNPPKTKGKFWPPVVMVLLTVGLFFAAQFVASLLFVFVALGAGWNDQQLSDWVKGSTLPQFLFVLIANSLIVTGVWHLLKRRHMGFKSIGLHKPTLKDFGLALLGYGCYFLLFLVITVVAKLLVPSLDLQQEQQLGFKPNQGTLSLLLAGISLVVLPPLVEEILTRGFLFTGLRQRLSLVWTAIITSLVFAAAHLQFGEGAPLLWVAAIDTFVLSLVLVYLRETTGKLAAPIFLHGLKNLIAFSLLFIFKI